MMKKYYYLLLITVLAACTSQIHDSVSHIQIHENLLKKVNVSDVVKSVRYVPLEYTDQSVISFIPKIVFSGEYIVVQNMVPAQMDSKLLVFDAKGKFITDIFEKGRAENEIIRMNDFDVAKNEVCVLDNARKRINRYSLQGKYIGYHQLPFYASAFSVLENNNFLIRLTPSNPFFLPADNYRVVTVNDKFELIDKVGNYNSAAQSASLGRTPYFVGNTFTFPYENVMIRADAEGKLDSICHFDTGKENLLKVDTENPYSQLSSSSGIELYSPPIESSSLITLYVKSDEEDKNGFLIYDKKKSLSCFIAKDYVLDRNDMFKLSPPIAYCEETDEFVYLTNKVTEEDVKTVGLEDILKRMSQTNRDILIGNETTSNIILVFVKFNDIEKLIEKYKNT